MRFDCVLVQWAPQCILQWDETRVLSFACCPNILTLSSTKVAHTQLVAQSVRVSSVTHTLRWWWSSLAIVAIHNISRPTISQQSSHQAGKISSSAPHDAGCNTPSSARKITTACDICSIVCNIVISVWDQPNQGDMLLHILGQIWRSLGTRRVDMEDLTMGSSPNIHVLMISPNSAIAQFSHCWSLTMFSF